MWDIILDWLDYELYDFGREKLILRDLISAGLIIILVLTIRWLLKKKFSATLSKYLGEYNVKDRALRNSFKGLLYTGGVLFFLNMSELDFRLFSFEMDSNDHLVHVSTLIKIVLVFFLARFIKSFFKKILLSKYYDNRNTTARKFSHIDELEDANRESANTSINWLAYLLFGLFAFQLLDITNLVAIPDYASDAEENKELAGAITFIEIIRATLVIIVARLVVWIIQNIILYNYYLRSKVDQGGQYAVNQLISYVLYVFAILIALQTLGINITVLLGGAAALLVGIGLGLQQTFNDLMSGIILLFDRTVEVNDVVQVGDVIGKVKKIGIRTSLIETQQNIDFVIPNSKLVTDNVVNWSHDNDDKVRFHVNIGVAYGSDTEKVRQILIEIAEQQPDIIAAPLPFVRFKNFGASALDFELHFWTRKLMPIEDLKSDLRFEIDKAFRKHEIEIPFPQHDVWMRKP